MFHTLQLEYQNGAKLLIDLEERDDLEYYRFRWSKPSDDVLPNLWVSFELNYKG